MLWWLELPSDYDPEYGNMEYVGPFATLEDAELHATAVCDASIITVPDGFFGLDLSGQPNTNGEPWFSFKVKPIQDHRNRVLESGSTETVANLYRSIIKRYTSPETLDGLRRAFTAPNANNITPYQRSVWFPGVTFCLFVIDKFFQPAVASYFSVSTSLPDVCGAVFLSLQMIKAEVPTVAAREGHAVLLVLPGDGTFFVWNPNDDTKLTMALEEYLTSHVALDGMRIATERPNYPVTALQTLHGGWGTPNGNCQLFVAAKLLDVWKNGPGSTALEEAVAKLDGKESLDAYFRETLRPLMPPQLRDGPYNDTKFGNVTKWLEYFQKEAMKAAPPELMALVNQASDEAAPVSLAVHCTDEFPFQFRSAPLNARIWEAKNTLDDFGPDDDIDLIEAVEYLYDGINPPQRVGRAPKSRTINCQDWHGKNYWYNRAYDASGASFDEQASIAPAAQVVDVTRRRVPDPLSTAVMRAV